MVTLICNNEDDSSLTHLVIMDVGQCNIDVSRWDYSLHVCMFSKHFITYDLLKWYLGSNNCI